MKPFPPVTYQSHGPDPTGGAAFELQPAIPEHAARIADIWARGWRDGHLGNVPAGLVAHRTPASFEPRALARVPATTVAIAPRDGGSGDVAGFVTVVDDEVEQLYVEGRWRGTGAADRLLAAAEQLIAERFDQAWLAVVAGNGRARRFYERAGWHDSGPFDNPAETAEGTLLVPTRRYLKDLTGQPKY